MNQIKTDIELIKLTLQDKDQFLCLVERYEDKIRNYIKRISDFSDEDCEDILQDVFIKSYENLNDFDENISSFNSWIYRIAHNETISRYRKIKWFSFFSLFKKDEQTWNETEIEIPSDIDIESDYEITQNKEFVEKILKLLKVEYRNVLVLKFIEDKSYEEISDILKIPQWTVATMINRAKKEFKNKVEQKTWKIK